MKMIKRIETAIIIILFAIVGISFTACGGDDDDDYKNENNWNNSGSGTDNNGSESEDNNGGNNGGNSGSTISLAEISKNVNVTSKAILEGYGYEINIKTKLPKAFPGKVFKYGVVCGYEGYDYCKYYTLSEEKTEYECVFIDADGVENGYYGEIYWKSLVALKEKEDTDESLSKDEKDLQKEIMAIFRKDGAYYMGHYKGKIFVEYNDKRYFIKSFGNK